MGGEQQKVLVSAIGNPDCGDDGVGPLVGQKLEGRLPDGAALILRRGGMLSLIDDWSGFDAMVCVDAAAPMGEPGRVLRIDLSEGELPPGLSFTSSHGFGLAEAIGLARTLGVAPGHIVVYAVEGRCFDLGATMTPEVFSAAGEVADRVAAEVQRLAGVSPL
jgi:hydrogenase maturation protease